MVSNIIAGLMAMATLALGVVLGMACERWRTRRPGPEDCSHLRTALIGGYEDEETAAHWWCPDCGKTWKVPRAELAERKQ